MADKPKIKNRMMDEVQLLFRNFSGAKGKFNREGDRNFSVKLDDPELVEEMLQEGWNVKPLKSREEDDEPAWHIKVKITFAGRRPPRIVLISNGRKTTLKEKNLNLLDWARITRCDVNFRAFQWTDSDGVEGVTAYLNSIYITIEDDPQEARYMDIPDSASSALLEDAEEVEEDFE